MTRNTTSPTHVTPNQTAIETINCLGNIDICYGPLIHRITGALIDLVDPRITTFVSTRELQKFKKNYHKSV